MGAVVFAYTPYREKEYKRTGNPIYSGTNRRGHKNAREGIEK